jgi:hypothetical protein
MAPPFLISALDRGEGSASLPEKSLRYPLHRSLAGEKYLASADNRT